MKKIEKIVKELQGYLNGKKILEIACGDSDFSIQAANVGEEILGTDISLDRWERREIDSIPDNLSFREMDATSLEIEDGYFNTAVCYNALGHVDGVLQQILDEMSRVVLCGGNILFITTWKLDKAIFPRLKDLVHNMKELEVEEFIDSSAYSVLAIKKLA